MNIINLQGVETPLNYPMVSLTKPPGGALIVDKAWVYLRHTRVLVAGRYVSLVQALGFYGEIEGKAYHNGTVEGTPDVSALHHSTAPMDLDLWLPTACRDVSIKYCVAAQRFHLAEIGADGKPITDRTDADLEQAFKTIKATRHVTEQTLTPDKNPDQITMTRNPNMPVIKGQGINVKALGSPKPARRTGNPKLNSPKAETSPSISVPPETAAPAASLPPS